MDQAPTHPRRVDVLLGGAAVTTVLGLLAAGAGWLLVDRPAGLGALVGTLLVVAVTGTGALLVRLVAGVRPAASLVVALLTYCLQLLLVLVAFSALEQSDLLGPTLDRQWLGGAVIGGVLVWLTSQVVLSWRARIPVYDLPARDPVREVVGRPEGGERRP